MSQVGWDPLDVKAGDGRVEQLSDEEAVDKREI